MFSDSLPHTINEPSPLLLIQRNPVVPDPSPIPTFRMPGRRLAPALAPLLGLAFGLVLAAPVPAPGQPPPSSNSATTRGTPDSNSRSSQAELDATLTRLVLAHLPHHYINDRDWGQHEKRWDGIELRREGIRWETKRRWKSVPHGTWKKYKIELLEPEQAFQLSVRNLREGANGTVLLDLHGAAHLQLEGRQTKWVKGVQLYSFSGEGHARVRLVVSLELKIELDFATLPPDLVLKARATDASLAIDEFHLDRISKVGGEVTQQLGRQLLDLLREQIAEREERLVAKINKEIEEEQDDLRLSLKAASESPWLEAAGPLLPDTVRDRLPPTPKRPPTPSHDGKSSPRNSP